MPPPPELCPGAAAHPGPPALSGLLVSDDHGLISALPPALAALGVQLRTRALTGGTPEPLRAGHARVAVVDLRSHATRGLLTLESLRHHGGLGQALALLALVPPGGLLDPQRALQVGADDFCAHPEDPPEIAARLQAIVRRQQRLGEVVLLRVGALELDPVARVARRRGVPLTLSARQFDLLHVLMQHPGEVLSRTRLQAELPLSGRERTSNVLEVHVHHLRRQIGAEYLTTVRGQGYLLRITTGP